MTETIPVFATPSPKVRKIGLERPWMWLASGWHDLCAAPAISLTYGLLFAVVGMGLMAAVWFADLLYVGLPLAAGFLLVGPILAVGLYEVSRKLHAEEKPSAKDAFFAWRRNGSQVGLMGLLLLLFFLAWVRLATLIFALFFSENAPDPLDTGAFVEKVFFLAESLPFLAFGVAVGAILATIVFSLSVVSIPMLIDDPKDPEHPINIITAVATSVAVVRHNTVTMALWAALIVLFITAGLVTFAFGLIVALPLIAHATWHAYRDVIEPG